MHVFLLSGFLLQNVLRNSVCWALSRLVLLRVVVTQTAHLSVGVLLQRVAQIGRTVGSTSAAANVVLNQISLFASSNKSSPD